MKTLYKVIEYHAGGRRYEFKPYQQEKRARDLAGRLQLNSLVEKIEMLVLNFDGYEKTKEMLFVLYEKQKAPAPANA